MNVWRSLYLPITPICKWRDDQPTRIPQVLVPIHDGSGDHAHCNHTFFKVVTQLGDPLEVVDIVDVIVRHLLHNVARCKMLENNAIDSVYLEVVGSILILCILHAWLLIANKSLILLLTVGEIYPQKNKTKRV